MTKSLYLCRINKELKIVGVSWVTEVLVDLNLKTREGVLAGVTA